MYAEHDVEEKKHEIYAFSLKPEFLGAVVGRPEEDLDCASFVVMANRNFVVELKEGRYGFQHGVVKGRLIGKYVANWATLTAEALSQATKMNVDVLGEVASW